MADDKLNGKVIVITGASSGFGKGSALRFAEAKAAVVLAARRDQLLDDLARECEEEGGRAPAVHTDVGSEEDIINVSDKEGSVREPVAAGTTVTGGWKS